MDDDLRARLYAVEILLAELIAAQLRAAEDPAEMADDALTALLPVVRDIPVNTMTRDDEAGLRLRIQDAVAEILKMAVRRAT